MTTKELTDLQRIAQVFRQVFISPNEMDINMEPANVVDGLMAIARAGHNIAMSIESLAEVIRCQSSPRQPASREDGD